MIREQSIRKQNMSAFCPMIDTYLHYFAGAFPESYRKPSETLTKKNMSVAMYMWAVLSGSDSGLADIRTVLANVENVVPLRCSFSTDSIYSFPKHGLKCTSDYQRHICTTI
jgi:hypothetical protein